MLIIGSIAVAYFGYEKYSESSNSLEIGKLEIKAQQTEKRNKAYMLFAASAVMLILSGSLLYKK